MDSKQKQILLVEDETIIAMHEARQLKEYGYGVITALSGEDAVNAALKNNVIDLVLMDINLGEGMDGAEAAEKILLERDIPIVFFSSHTDIETVSLTEKIASYGYVVKNSGPTVLDASIQMAFRLHEAHRKIEEREKTLSEKEELFRMTLESSNDAVHSDRKKVEEALRKSEELYRSAFYNPGMGIFIVEVINEESFRYLDINPTHEKMVGFPREWIKGKSPYDLKQYADNDTVEYVLSLYNKVLQTGKTYEFEEEIGIGDKKLHFYTQITPIFDENKKITRLIGAILENSERKKAERALTNTVKEKEALFRELQHRVKNSLAMIAGIISLEADEINDPVARDIINKIYDRVMSMSRLYTMLFDSGMVEKVDLNQYLRGLIESLSSSYTHSSMEILIETKIDVISFDIKRSIFIGLIVTELVSNAFKYAFAGRQKGKITILLEKSGDTIILEISDNGARFPGEFDIRKSTSLGLKLVEMLTEQLNGSMEYEDGENTLFRIIVPEF
ncbi:MAG: response regulator [bacterium]|nr:response regulator [bacterium]